MDKAFYFIIGVIVGLLISEFVIFVVHHGVC
jgi:hypothetical protein